MNPSAPFIRRPVATTLLMFALLAFGLTAYRTLPISDLPNVDFPTILVTANLPGANADTMAAAVATPLERQFSTIAGLDAMNSTSVLGATQITLQFSLERNLDGAALDVQAAIAAAARLLPPQMPSPPTYQKVNPAELPILYVAVTAPALPLMEIDRYAETQLAQRISMVSGVAQVQVFGAQKFAVRVQVSPEALASRNLGIDQVADAVAAANVNLPTGILDGKDRALTVQAHGQLLHAAEYRPVIVAYRNGSPVRLEALGRVVDSVENNKTAAWFGREQAVILAVQRQPGTNAVAVSRAVQAILPRFRGELPASVSLRTVYNRADSIEASVNDVKLTLLITLALVVLVIFVFLQNLSATLIPSVTLPLSLIGTFAVMKLCGYSLDNLSLMGLTLSVGFVIDDAIVMLENIVRHVEMKKSRIQAAFDGAYEIGFTIVSMTLSLAAVFIPILFMGGLVGRLFHEFAVTIAVAILLSGMIALTLTPMLASRMLRVDGEQRRQRGRFFRAWEAFYDRLLSLYRRSLGWSLDHSRTLLLSAAVTLAATIFLFLHIPKGFLPSEDTGQIFAATEAAQGISYESMVRHQTRAAQLLGDDPDVESYVSSVGARAGSTSTLNTGILFAHLKPRAQRKRSVDQIIAELRPKMAQIPGLRVYLQNPPPIRIGGVLTKSQYQFTLSGTNSDELYRAAQLLEQRMHQIRELLDVTSDLQIRNPQVEVTIDRDRAATLGITASQIETTLQSAYATRQVSTIYATDNTYQVILELLPEDQQDPEMLRQLYVRSANGQVVPLQAVADFRLGAGPLAINHSGQLPSVTVSFNLAQGAALGPAVAAVQRVAAQVVPPGISTQFQGAAQAFQSSLAGLGWLLLLAVAVIYIVLGILYESFAHPITILTALPFACVGALLTLVIFHQELTVYAFVGVIMLVGLVKKNGIMMIDFALDARRQGRSPRDAIFDACLVRFRPITMTTLAALMGTLPIALGVGAGSESRRPLGLAVVGGLLFSQLLTLFVTPVFYLAMERLRERSRRGSGVK